MFGSDTTHGGLAGAEEEDGFEQMRRGSQLDVMMAVTTCSHVVATEMKPDGVKRSREIQETQNMEHLVGQLIQKMRMRKVMLTLIRFCNARPLRNHHQEPAQMGRMKSSWMVKKLQVSSNSK
jgi:hypothetical protein